MYDKIGKEKEHNETEFKLMYLSDSISI